MSAKNQVFWGLVMAAILALIVVLYKYMPGESGSSSGHSERPSPSTSASSQSQEEAQKRAQKLEESTKRAPDWPNLLHAADAGDVSDVKRHLRHKADPNERGDEGQTALHIVANKGPGKPGSPQFYFGHQPNRGHPQIAFLLVEAGANVNARDNQGMTPLANAVATNNLVVARLLINKGANPNPKLLPSNTNLLLSAEGMGLTEMAKLLREFGAITGFEPAPPEIEDESWVPGDFPVNENEPG